MVPAIIGAGLLQSLGGLITRSQGKSGLASAEAEYKQNPYAEDSSITNLYNRQLAATNVSPIESAEGRLGQQQIQRNLLTALRGGGRQGRNVEGILRAGQDSTAKMIGNLSAQKRAERGLLGQFAGMKAADRRLAYKYNVLDPIGRKYNLSAQQMAEGGAMASSGVRNIISGLSAFNSTSGKKDASTGSTGSTTP